MGTMRHLPDPHPIYKLLRPHFRYTMAINSRARATLINDGGIIDKIFAIGGEGRRELMRRGGTAYNIHWTNIKRNAKERGVDDQKTLPGYYYRDDGLKLWINFGQYIFFGFVPNAPAGLRRPPPTRKGADYQDILESLPDKSTSVQSITTVYTLAQFSSDEV